MSVLPNTKEIRDLKESQAELLEQLIAKLDLLLDHLAVITGLPGSEG